MQASLSQTVVILKKAKNTTMRTMRDEQAVIMKVTQDSEVLARKKTDKLTQLNKVWPEFYKTTLVHAERTTYIFQDCGSDLKTEIARLGGPLPLETCYSWAIGMIQELQKLHQAGFCHCRPYLEHFVINASGQIRLISLERTKAATSAQQRSDKQQLAHAIRSFLHTTLGFEPLFKCVAMLEKEDYSLDASLTEFINASRRSQSTDMTLADSETEVSTHNPTFGRRVHPAPATTFYGTSTMEIDTRNHPTNQTAAGLHQCCGCVVS